ncbi:MAG: hypothetical protein ABI608_06240 [Rhizomicrobium sp.]
MATTPRPQKSRFEIGFQLFAALFAAVFFGIFSLYIAVKALQGGESIVPDKASLQIVSGRLLSHSVVEHNHAKTRDVRHIHITVESQGAKRELTLREEAFVWNALCDGCSMVLWLDDEKIWQFSVGGKIIRSYEGERQYYIDLFKNNGPRDILVILVTALASIAGFAAAYFRFGQRYVSSRLSRDLTTRHQGNPDRQESGKDWLLGSGGFGEAAMTDLEPTGVRLAKIWWFMMWRGLLGGLLIGYGTELTVISLFGVFFGGVEKQAVQQITNLTIPLIMTPVAIVWSGYALRMALGKKFADFRIALLPLASVADSGSLEPSWNRLAKMWWFMVWRGFLGGILIAFAVLFVVAFLVGLSGVGETISGQLKTITKTIVFPATVFLWIGYAIRMIFRKKFADFRIALLPLAS